MSNMQIDQVLAQIRSLATQASQPSASRMQGPAQLMGSAAAAQPQGAPGTFATMLKNGLDQVNSTEMRATDLAARFERGEPGVDLPQVMLEANKASISLQAVNQVRNRLVSAYQDIMNMQL